MRIGSLFSGYGGLDMAVQAVIGGDLAWYSEIEPAACKVLAAHHPDVPNLGDITAVDWSAVPPVDVLTGGYPCQPFSHAGQRKGTNDHRHLWPYVREALAALRPMVAVFENVDGHRSLGLDVVLGDLADLGLSARWGVVRAADAGAPHGRKRVFIVAYPEGGRWGAGQGLAEAAAGPVGSGVGDDGGAAADTIGERHNRSGASRAEAGEVGGWPDAQGPADTAADAVGQGSRGTGTAPNRRVRAERNGHAQSSVSESTTPDADGAGGQARGDAGHDGQRLWVEPLGSADVVADADHATDDRQRSRTESRQRSQVDWGKYEPAIRRWEAVIDRDAPAPTIPGANGRPRLSPAFVEWMMGLPEGHVTGHGLSNAQALKMLGNGVVPQQAALALQLLGVAA